MDPENHISSADKVNILSDFESTRGDNYKHGPAMYIVTPNDRNQANNSWEPTYTQIHPERVILSRIQALAKRSFDHLMKNCLMSGSTDDKSWTAIFQESPNSMKSYSALLRIHPDYIVCSDCSSMSGIFDFSPSKGSLISPYTRALEKIALGPKPLKKKLYKNVNQRDSVLVSEQFVKLYCILNNPNMCYHLYDESILGNQ